MAQGYIPYVTRQGDRWDLLAWEFYGNAFHFGPIIAANPTVAIVPILPAGVELAIPLLDEEAAADVLDADLPPWKRPADGDR